MPASHEVEEVSLWGLVQTQMQSQGWRTPLFISYIILQVTHTQSRPANVNLLVIPIVKPADTRKDFRPISAISYHLHCPTDAVTVTTPEAFASLMYFSCFRRDFTPLNVIYTDELADRTCLLTHNQITTKSPRWHVPLVHHPAHSSGWKCNFFLFYVLLAISERAQEELQVIWGYLEINPRRAAICQSFVVSHRVTC